MTALRQRHDEVLNENLVAFNKLLRDLNIQNVISRVA
jgi:hypothetical protein